MKQKVSLLLSCKRISGHGYRTFHADFQYWSLPRISRSENGNRWRFLCCFASDTIPRNVIRRGDRRRIAEDLLRNLQVKCRLKDDMNPKTFSNPSHQSEAFVSSAPLSELLRKLRGNSFENHAWLSLLKHSSFMSELSK